MARAMISRNVAKSISHASINDDINLVATNNGHLILFHFKTIVYQNEILSISLPKISYLFLLQ